MLRQVYFPSVTVCNINQVRESFLLDMNLTRSDPEGQVCTQSYHHHHHHHYHHYLSSLFCAPVQRIISLLYRQFYSGSSTPTSAQEQAIVKAFLTSQNYVRAGQ